MQHDMFGELLSTARENLFIKARMTSAHCPCCDKHVKVYKRKMNSGMARTLIYTYPFFKAHPSEFLDVGHYMARKVPDLFPADYGKLFWWGLMERREDQPTKGAKQRSLYRMTIKGLMFTERKINVPEFVIEYRSTVESFSETTVDIAKALGKHFNYQELMQTPGVF